MKSLITNNWQKIIIGIGIIGTMITVFAKLIAPKMLLDNYVKYGKEVEGTSQIADKVSSTIGNSANGVTPGLVKLTIVFMVAILFVVLITSLGSKSSADKGKKK